MELVAVPHRGAALWIEDQVLVAVRTWPVTGEPLKRRVTGWTEMWADSAPVRIALRDYLAAAAAVPIDPGLVRAWRTDRQAGNAPDPAGVSLRLGDRICLTGRGGASDETRHVWRRRALAAGLKPTDEVGVGVRAVVIGETGAGAQKLRRAHELGIPTVGYEAFRQLLSDLRDLDR